MYIPSRSPSRSGPSPRPRARQPCAAFRSASRRWRPYSPSCETRVRFFGPALRGGRSRRRRRGGGVSRRRCRGGGVGWIEPLDKAAAGQRHIETCRGSTQDAGQRTSAMRDERSASLVALASSRARCRARGGGRRPLEPGGRSRCLFFFFLARLLLGRALVAHLEEARVARGRLHATSTCPKARPAGEGRDAPRFAGRPFPRV